LEEHRLLSSKWKKYIFERSNSARGGSTREKGGSSLWSREGSSSLSDLSRGGACGIGAEKKPFLPARGEEKALSSLVFEKGDG